MKSSLLGMLAVLVALACWLMLRGDPQITPATDGGAEQQQSVIPTGEGAVGDPPEHAREAAALPEDGKQDDEQPPPVPAIVGRIIDTAARPVSGASVRVWPSASTDPRQVVSVESEVDGLFRVEVNSGAWNLAAHHAAHGKVARQALQLGGEDLQVGDLVLQPQPALLGRLVYADGRPIGEYEVRVGAVHGGMTALTSVRHEEVLTDADGRFAIRDLDQGTYELQLRFMDFRDEARPQLRLTTGHSEQELVIDRHRVRLRNSDDLGIRGWREERKAEIQNAQRTGEGWKALWDSTDLWAAGNVSDSLVPRGSWWYLDYSKGDKWGEAVVHADRTRNETDVVMKLRSSELYGILRLRVRAADGSVPTSAKLSRIYATALGSPEYHEDAPRDGEDFMFRVAPGRYSVVMRVGVAKNGLDAFAPVKRDIQIRANEETLLDEVVRAGGRVQMTVHLPSGKKGEHLSRFKAATLDESGHSIDVRPYHTQIKDGYRRGTPRSGTLFTCVRILRPGRHEFTVTVKGYQPVRVSAFLEDGKGTPVDVYLRK